MDNRYFPHKNGGTNYKLREAAFDANFNFSVNGPTAIDPRNIISEWTSDALLTMTENDVYAGLQIYCLDDKTYRICRWVPTAKGAIFSAKNCLWDILHSKDDDAEWINVKTDDWYIPNIDELISREEDKSWRYVINNTDANLYLGFYKFADADFSELDTEEGLHKVFNNVIVAPELTWKNTYKFTNLAIKSTDTITINLEQAYSQVDLLRDHHLVVIIPKDVYRYDIEVTGMTNSIDVPFTTKHASLEVINNKDRNLHSVSYDIYVMNSAVRYTSDESSLINMTCNIKKVTKN